MAKKQEPIIKDATVLSKTVSGEQIIVSLQGTHGSVHTLYLTKEEATGYELGDTVVLTLAQRS